MHNPLKSWKPLPAAKPSHLATSPADQTPVSLAALKGATSAFASSSTTSLPDVGQLRRKYETAGTNAGFVSRGRPADPQPDNEEVYADKTSPPRGRHLSPEDAIVAGARSAANNRSPSSASKLDRSPSMIAARLVSSSPSPVRGRPAVSPSELPSSGEQKVVRPPLSTSGSLSNKNLKAPSPIRISKTGQNKEVTPSLDLEKTPILSPSQKNTVPQIYQKNSPLPTRSDRPQAAPALNHASTMNITSSRDGGASSSPINIPTMRPPPAPAPRKGRIMARSPLQADLTGPRSAPGVSREEAINRMADAMVASSLASTRPSSPSKRGLGRPEIRRSESARASYRPAQTAGPMLPTPTKPIRPMKQTLRKESPEDEEEDNKRGRRHLVRKHPNMHHEGDRKRWRDKVTENERRRYEGVFAANRGLHLRAADTRASPSRLMDPNAESNHVVNVVVRDIWERSRLSAHILEQIYELVAPDEAKTLSREQFVVGLWLIDQKLKGRKLPVKVSESVWASVRHTHGITMGH